MQQMYATSKLIIPPKPARDTPFIPKLRIRLRPSPTHDSVSSDCEIDFGAVQFDEECMSSDITTDVLGMPPISDACSDVTNGKTDLPRDIGSESNVNNSGSKIQSKCLKRTISKRKSTTVLNEIDMHSPDSVLTKVNLKTLINRETFFSFPLDVQQMLSNLLPLFDRDKESWSNCSSSLNDSELCNTTNIGEFDSQPDSVWLHPTALNNEFFTKALKDFSDRQARGELTPRVRNRAGLRTHVGNRCRYTPFDDSTLGDFDVGAENENSPSASKKSTLGSANSRNRTRRSSRSKTKASTQRSSDISVDSEVPSNIPSDFGFIGRSPPSKKVNDTQSSSNLEGVEPKKTRRSSLRVASNSSYKDNSDSRNGKLSPSSYLEQNEQDESTALENNIMGNELKTSPTSESYLLSICSSLNTDPIDSSKPMDLEELGSRSSGDSLNGNGNNNHNDNNRSNNNNNDHYLHTSPCDSLMPDSANSTPPLSTAEIGKLSMLEKNSLELDPLQIETPTRERNSNVPKSKQNHPRRLSLDSKFATSPNGKQVSPNASTRGSRPPRSSVVGSDGVAASPSMPPPRQTKTLAAMREKLRAKRLMKESERGLSGQAYYGLPGSMTPHPASGSSGYFRQPKNYPSQNNFSPFREKMDRQSSSVLSSPNNFNASFMNERQSQSSQSVNLSALLNDNYEPNTANLISGSPCSPYSAPSVEIMSPLISFHCHSTESYSSGTSNETISRSLATSNPKCYTPPQRLVSSSDCSINNVPSLSSCSPDSFLPGQAKLHEQSASAPSTPLTPQSGQNMSSCWSLPSSQLVGPSTSSISNSSTIQWTPINQSLSTISPKSVEPAAIQSNNLITQTTLPSGLVPQTSVGSNQANYSVPIPKDSQTTVKVAVSSSTAPSNTAPLLLSQNEIKPNSSSDKPSAIPLPSASAVTKLLTAAGQSRPSTTTRAFFVDGDNLPEAVAFLQSLNPKATITQQQFLLIPTANKSRMFLCRAPATNASDVLASLGPRNSNANSAKTEPISIAAVLQAPSLPATASGSEMKVTTSTSVVADVQPSVIPNRSSYVRTTSENRPSSDLDDLNTTELSKCLSDAQVSRSLVYSNSVNATQNGTAVSMSVLKPLVKQIEVTHDRSNIVQTVKHNPPKVAISSSTNMMNYPLRPTIPQSVAQNTKQPVQHSQLTISLLGSSPSVINHDIPVVLVQDRNQHTVRPQPAPLPNNMGWIHSSPFDQHLTNPILSSPTVITAHTTPNTNEFRRVQQSVVQPISSAQLQNHTYFNNNNHFGVQPFHSVQSSFTNPGVSTSFLSAPTATIIPPCLPAVILSHPLNIQSSSPSISNNPSIFTRSLP